MGMYTELLLKCQVKMPKDELSKNIILYLFDDEKTPVAETPDHPFFRCERWRSIGGESSYYHHPENINSIAGHHPDKEFYLFSRSDLKNYGNEIELFLDWFMPFIDELDGDCIGWQWYEEDREPTLLYKKEIK